MVFVDESVERNRLAEETSPYLRQHADNPVHWFAWGPEALARAQALNRPILLSVGYSTCHWCHVMAHESFDDDEIAEVINANYVAIKVDREERPDIDAIYMHAVQAMSGHGGWPMTVWLTPEGKPFFAGTYIPARDGDRGARFGFLTILKELSARYQQDPDKAGETAEHIAQAIRQALTPTSGSVPDVSVIDRAMDYYRSRYDDRYGGIKPAPKFPSSLPIRLLLRQYHRRGDHHALDMATHTLKQMSQGGIYDHLAGGFHRYSTDERWLVPHFEKMLYDNALLVLSYLEAYRVSRDPAFATAVHETLMYVQREMTTADGAFYSATDADSETPQGEHEEGWFFTWTPRELVEVLGNAVGELAAQYYGVSTQGNFEGRSVLHVDQTLDAFAAQVGKDPVELNATLDAARAELLEARNRRPRPSLDDKVLTAWNGLMIQAFARAARLFGSEGYKASALGAAKFVLDKLRKQGQLYRSYSQGQARHAAYLDDYASLIAGLLDVFELTADPQWLREAQAFDRILEEHYEDKEHGGFFMTSHDHESLIAREKPAYDGAEPSGNSVQALNLSRLHSWTTDDRYRSRRDATFKAFGPRMAAMPMAMSEMLVALDQTWSRPKEVVIVTLTPVDLAAPFVQAWRERFVPDASLLVVDDARLAELSEVVPWLQGKHALEGRTTAYVCQQGTCSLPTTDPAIFAQQLTTQAN